VPRHDVRDKLQSLASAMESALRRMTDLPKACDFPSLEAWNRVVATSYNASGDTRTIEQAADALASALEVVRRVQAELPKQQRRSNAASPLPVQLIHEALLRGKGKAYVRVREGEGDDSPPPDRTPRFPFKPSIGPKSAFREVVGICYAAIRGTEGRDPQRALKNYMRWLKKERSRQLKVDSPTTPQVGTEGVLEI
jgi:hypothetical protein